MKSTVLYHYYGPVKSQNCCRIFSVRYLALTSAIYVLNISILVILLYSWQINVNVRKNHELGDVYYGVQIAYYAIIGTQLSMILLSIVLIIGIFSENAGLIVPWMIGFLTFMALEAVAMMYANVLRDHIYGKFDGLCKAEVAFFIARAVINALAMWSVMKFYHLLRVGVSFKYSNQNIIEL